MSDVQVHITYLYACWGYLEDADDGWYLQGDTASEAIDYMYSHPEWYTLPVGDIPEDFDMVFRGHVFKVEWPGAIDQYIDQYIDDSGDSGSEICFLHERQDTMIVKSGGVELDEHTATGRLIDYIPRLIDYLEDYPIGHR